MKNMDVTGYEKRILAGLVGLLLITVVVLMVLQVQVTAFSSLPPLSKSHTAEVAVLVPLSGPQAVLGKAVLTGVQQLIAAQPVEGWQVDVVAYDTEGTLQGAAQQAMLAAQNPNTAVIIGPLSAAEVTAVKQSLDAVKAEIALISPASALDDLPNDVHDVYVIPASEAQLGEVLVQSVLRIWLTPLPKDQRLVYLVGEGDGYHAAVFKAFTQSAEKWFVISGAKDLSNEDTMPDETMVQEIVESKAAVVVFLGSAPKAKALLELMAAANVEVPVLGSGAFYDPMLLPLPENTPPTFFLSPFVQVTTSGNQQAVYYRELLGDAALQPLAYEGALAANFAVQALGLETDSQSGDTAVERIRTGLPKVLLSDWHDRSALRLQRHGAALNISQTIRPTGGWLYLYWVNPKNWDANQLLGVEAAQP